MHTMNVDELLTRYSVTGPPVPVERIVEELGLVVCPLPASDDISGAMIRSGGRGVIVINPSHPPNRRRFTIAHELGHYLLHEGVQEHVDQDFRIKWRNAESSQATNVLEIEANRFAAELLMPRSFLFRDLSSWDSISESHLKMLARRYEVSAQAMEFRLINLGVLSPA